ncbi:MAG: DUF4259 domain-containing protein [Myxococcales bacterium]|nr:DUF4259 domain-containing protein [Myxococcales bacterium]MCB9735621.1 DUF4259 domain-containing protein [Deltaproteobacteria bacterium]
MDVWGPSALQNDDAMEWLGTLEDEEDLGLVDEALDAVTEADDEDVLEADACCVALAAAEVVAALAGKPSPRLPDGIKEMIEGEDPPDGALIDQAIEAIGRVRGDSELLIQWNEHEDGPEDWFYALDELTKRLTAAKKK